MGEVGVVGEGLFPPLLSPAEGFFLAASKSTVFSLPFSALSVAACAARLATGVNSARWSKFSKSSPGANRMFTALMFFEVNFSKLSAGSQLIEIPNVPNSPSWILLPLSSCSTKHSHMSLNTPLTVPRLKTPLCEAMCLANFSNDQISFTWFFAYAFAPASGFMTLVIMYTL